MFLVDMWETFYKVKEDKLKVKRLSFYGVAYE